MSNMEAIEAEFLLSQYRELSEIARNERTKVLLVEKTATKELFVMKLLPQESDINIFMRLKYLIPANTPRIYEVFNYNNQLHIIEEYIAGSTLNDVLEKEKLDIKQCKIIIVKLCDILSKLHDAIPPIIHRDIKPSNIIITPDNAVKLIDFDISRTYKAIGSKDTRIIGTEYYIAPEQYGSAQTDARSDIYAIGKLMIYITTKQEISAKDVIPYLHELAPIVKKCCEIDPINRYQTVSELKRAITKRGFNLNLKRKTVVFTLFSISLILIAVSLIQRKSLNILMDNESISISSENIPADNKITPSPTFDNQILNVESNKPIFTESPVESYTPTDKDNLSKESKETPSPQPTTINDKQAVVIQPKQTPTATPTLSNDLPLPTASISKALPTATVDVQDEQGITLYTKIKASGKIIGITSDNSIISTEDTKLILTEINGQSKDLVNYQGNYAWGPKFMLYKSQYYLMVTTTGNKLEVYDIPNNLYLGCIEKQHIETYLFTPDGKSVIAFAYKDSTGAIGAFFYDIKSDSISKQFDCHERVMAADINPNKNEIALFYFDKIIQVRDLNTWDLLYTVDGVEFENSNGVFGLKYSQDGKNLVVQSYDKVFTLDATNSYKLKKEPQIDGKSVDVLNVYDNKLFIKDRYYDFASSTWLSLDKSLNLKQRIVPSQDKQFLFTYLNWGNECIIYKTNGSIQ